MTQFTWSGVNFLKRTNPFGKFLFVGIINTLIGCTVIFLIMDVLNQGYWLSTFLGNGTGMLCSFFLNRKFTFNSRIPVCKGGVMFLFAACLCYFPSYFASEKIVGIINEIFLKNSLGYEKELSVLLGMFFYTNTNYFAQKHVVFSKK